MKLIISLDYELFFGNQIGSVEKCLIEPTNKLAELAQKHNILLSIFVDAGFLSQLNIYRKKYKALDKDFIAVSNQLSQLKKQQHDIQLHIHPHWEDSYFNGEKWCLNTERYKLHDYSANEIETIVRNYKQTLVEIVNDDSVFAYRAGGWCIQPFTKIQDALKNNNIWIDSTVFPNGISDDAARGFDFTLSPEKDLWQFSTNPLVEDKDGYFLEVPISSYHVSPLFFWRFLYAKLFLKNKYKGFGDGNALKFDRNYYLDKLLYKTFMAASVDGYKSSLLKNIYLNHKAANKEIMNIMGHPKALSPASIESLNIFLTEYRSTLNPVTFQFFKK